ncbi:hypothetical protein [Deinococcus sp.]|uniref:hypothetical protein n=1 Tax=Deinococcus sp. TaxID=47478 RepID=UPI003CC69813
MLSMTLAARAMRHKPRTSDAERYRLKVRDVLPCVPVEQRHGAALHITLHPLTVALGLQEVGGDFLRLACTPQTFGLRWWLVCPKCGRRRAALYWLGHREVGWWRCRVCLGLKYTSSATHRTVSGDLARIEAGRRESGEAWERAKIRDLNRLTRMVRRLKREGHLQVI